MSFWILLKINKQVHEKKLNQVIMLDWLKLNTVHQIKVLTEVITK